MLARHVSELTGPSSAVFSNLVCGNTRTTRHVQQLRSCRTAYILQDDTRSLQYLFQKMYTHYTIYIITVN